MRRVDVVDVGQARQVWARRRGCDMDGHVRPTPKGDDGLPAVTSKEVGGRAAGHPDRGAIDSRQYGVDSRGLGRVRREWLLRMAMLPRKDRDDGASRHLAPASREDQIAGPL